MKSTVLGLAVLVCCAPPSNGLAASVEGKIVSITVTQGPTVDGKGGDAAWKSAKETTVVAKGVFPSNAGKSTVVSMRSAHTKTHVYFLVRWRDETRDDQAHKPFVWDSGKNVYVEGPEREDMFALAFEHTGPFTADMLSPVEAVWDVWHWKATRTNPQGFAMDKTHRYTREQWQGKGKSHPARNGEPIWIARPEDAGDTVERRQTAPGSREGERVPQYLPGTPTGSAADVRAKGAWSDGWWTLELERKLSTGYPDDTAFDPKRTYKMAVSTHDRTGDMDKASGILELAFGGR